MDLFITLLFKIWNCVSHYVGFCTACVQTDQRKVKFILNLYQSLFFTFHRIHWDVTYRQCQMKNVNQIISTTKAETKKTEVNCRKAKLEEHKLQKRNCCF